MMHEGWYHHWVSGATLDNQLWHQALVMDHVLESLWGSEQGSNDMMMWTLLQHGILDVGSDDSPWDSSTWSMRYLAILVGCLLDSLASERTRVSLHLLFLVIWTDLWVFRGIVWKGNSTR